MSQWPVNDRWCEGYELTPDERLRNAVARMRELLDTIESLIGEGSK